MNTLSQENAKNVTLDAENAMKAPITAYTVMNSLTELQMPLNALVNKAMEKIVTLNAWVIIISKLKVILLFLIYIYRSGKAWSIRVI